MARLGAGYRLHMSGSRTGSVVGRHDAPEFAEPPVVEVALGVQFHPLPALRGITLAPLRERWRTEYPRVEEQPPLAPAIEAGPMQGIAVQVGFGPVPTVRYMFLNEAGSEFVQLQNDRLVVNWREAQPPTPYPRYERMRTLLGQRLAEVSEFVEQNGLGSIQIVQAELNYVNAIEVDDGQQGRLDRVLRGWAGTSDHHLGDPEQARALLVFSVPDVGRHPVRMYVGVDPAQRIDGSPVLFMTLTVRGAPAGAMIDNALQFMDQGHDHLVRSFSELTPEPMHTVWGRRS